MAEASLAEKLAFLQAQHQRDAASLLARALRDGVEVHHREALVAGFATPSLAFGLGPRFGSR